MVIKSGPPGRMTADAAGALGAPGAPDLGLRAIIAISNPVSRFGLEAMLRKSPHVRYVAIADGPGEAENLLGANRWDLLIASATTAQEGRHTLREAARCCGARMLLMLRGQARDDIARAVTIDADGYLVEEDLTTQLLNDTIRRLVRGEMLLPTSFVQNLLETSQEMRPVRTLQALSRRERHVLRLLVDGLSNKQIATELSISAHGAKRHVANVLAKLNCANRTHAVALALQCGLLDERSGAAKRSGAQG